MVRYGCGWLGWPPDVVLRTPFPLIHMALEGLSEFRSLLAGGKPKTAPQRLTKAQRQQKIRAAFSGLKKPQGAG